MTKRFTDVDDIRRAMRSGRMSRRMLLSATAGLSLTALLAACGGDDDDDGAEAESTETTSASGDAATESATSTSEASATETSSESTSASSATEATDGTAAATTGESSSGGWSFTDDRGKEITLPSRPERVVAEVGSAAALWDLGIQVVGIFGPAVTDDGEREAKAGNIDLDAVESIGEGFEDFDLEALIALEPDLIVSTMYDDETLWMIDPEVLPQVEQIAPAIGINIVAKPVTDLIERFADLAKSLGADLQATAHTEAKARFEELSERVSSIVAEKPGLTVLAVAGGEEALYIGNPDMTSDLMYFAELGVEMVDPEGEESYFSSELSWEQATKYPSDVILNDIRSAWYSIEQLVAVPSMAEHPAVKAGQVGNWHTEYIISYRGFGDVLEDLAGLLEESRADVV